jgi:hypothetical protein
MTRSGGGESSDAGKAGIRASGVEAEQTGAGSAGVPAWKDDGADRGMQKITTKRLACSGRDLIQRPTIRSWAADADGDKDVRKELGYDVLKSNRLIKPEQQAES